MTWYAVYHISDGQLHSLGQSPADDAALTAVGMAKKDVGPTQPQGPWNPVTRLFDPPPPPPNILTPSGFKQRFTQAERVAIRAAADSDTVIDDLLDILATAQDVDMADPNVTGGLDYMESQGLITATRKDEIINGS